MAKTRNDGPSSNGRPKRKEEALELRPLTARSVILSTLLGTHPPRLPVRSLVKVGELFDIPEGTVRVALSRMVADGDVVAHNSTYALSTRLAQRAVRQDESRAPRTRSWSHRRWTVAIVIATGRPAAERTALRRAMAELRLAERREGVWMRPANLHTPDPLPSVVWKNCLWFEGHPDEDPVALARSLWDLDAWADRARRLHDALDDATDLADGFVVSAAVLRHLVADPVLPPELVPDDWPADALRARYDAFDDEYRRQLHAYVRD